MTSSVFIRRALALLVTAGMATSIAACASNDSGSQSAAAGTQVAASEGGVDTPSYERKRGEALEPLLEEWMTGDQTADSTGISLPLNNVFHDVRGGEHPDFYRVIVEFKRDSQPGKRGEEDAMHAEAKWTDAAVSQGKGDKLDNAGQAFLDVVLDGTTMPEGELEKLYYAGEKNLTFAPIDVSIDGSYEGRTHVVIGMDKQREYQMSFLEGPTRLVIDIKK